MRRIWILVCCSLMWIPRASLAQDRAGEAAARAQREESEERYKLLNGKIESLAETQEALLSNQNKLQQQIAKLGSEIDDLRHAQTQAGSKSATQDQIKYLDEKLKEIEKKRVEDKELILKTLKDLQKVPMASLPQASEKPSQPLVSEPTGPAWDYTVKANDTLQKIVIGYNQELDKRGLSRLTVSQVLKANPGLNPNKLFAGKKILIPIPPKKGEKAQ